MAIAHDCALRSIQVAGSCKPSLLPEASTEDNCWKALAYVLFRHVTVRYSVCGMILPMTLSSSIVTDL